MKSSKEKKQAAPRLLANGAQHEPTRSEIAFRAYSLWEQQGFPQHKEVQIWLQAETQLRQTRNPHGARA